MIPERLHLLGNEIGWDGAVQARQKMKRTKNCTGVHTHLTAAQFLYRHRHGCQHPAATSITMIPGSFEALPQRGESIHISAIDSVQPGPGI